MFDATEEGPSCPHPDGVLQAEDCLRLNVYTTKVNNHRTRYLNKISMQLLIYNQSFLKFHLFIYFFFLATMRREKCKETGYDIHTSRRFY